MSSPSFTQTRFRVRNDDGNETTATWQQAENVNATVAVGTRFRVRLQIDETASVAWTNVTWNLRYSQNGGAYAALSGTTPIQFSLSANFADGANTTSQLTAATGTYVAANAALKEAQSAVNSGTAGQYFDSEWSVIIDSTQVANGDTLDLRVYNGTSAIAAYTQSPRITVSKPATGTMAATEAQDTTAFAGTVLVQGAMAATEAADVAAAAGKVVVQGPMAVTEAQDTVDASGTVTGTGSGAVAAVVSGPTPAGSSSSQRKRRIRIGDREYQVSTQRELMAILEELMKQEEPEPKREQPQKELRTVIKKGVPVMKFAELREFATTLWQQSEDISLPDLSRAVERFKQIQEERRILEERDIEDLLALADAEEREELEKLQHQLAQILRLIH